MKRLALLVVVLTFGVMVGGCQQEPQKKKTRITPLPPPVVETKEAPQADEATKKAEADKKVEVDTKAGEVKVKADTKIGDVKVDVDKKSGEVKVDVDKKSEAKKPPEPKAGTKPAEKK